MRRLIAGLVFFVAVPTFAAHAQGRAEVVIQPEFANTPRQPQLSDLVLAKIADGDDGSRVIFMLESYRAERRTVKVTRLVNEQRTRQIDVDGKTVTQNYVIKVPVIEEREITINSPAGRKPLSIDSKKLRFFNLDGEQVPIDEAAEQLTSLRPVFLIDQLRGNPKPLPELAKQALDEDCLIAVTAERVRPQPVGVPAPFAVPRP
jgi:hypothetical protein